LIIGGSPLFGPEEFVEDLKALSNQLKLNNYIHFIRFKENPGDYFSVADLCVLPSLQEPFGRVLVEAMHWECAVLGFNQGGVSEIIVQGQNGVLVANRQVDELTIGLKTVLQNPEELKKMGSSGKQMALNKFSLTQCVEAVKKLYNELW